MSDFLMDAHMHFDLYKKREEVLSYIESHHSYTIAVTNLPELYERYYRQYADYKYIKIALGFHPELAFQYENQLPIFLKYLDTTRYIGEIGLDFSVKDKENQRIQIKIFSEIVQACKKTGNKILSVHSRRAESDCISILGGYTGKIILHWYSGSISVLRDAINIGCYFSINHQMLLSKNGKSIVNAIPLERILIESDAPFTKELEKDYSVSFNNEIIGYLSETRNYTEEYIKKIIKNNFRQVLS
ncbi:MAG: TatD family hydrolase [Lachnospiraceae bacterium]|nr:TatD family hydrolase [Lachnospiraceae bacterium]